METQSKKYRPIENMNMDQLKKESFSYVKAL